MEILIQKERGKKKKRRREGGRKRKGGREGEIKREEGNVITLISDNMLLLSHFSLV